MDLLPNITLFLSLTFLLTTIVLVIKNSKKSDHINILEVKFEEQKKKLFELEDKKQLPKDYDDLLDYKVTSSKEISELNKTIETLKQVQREKKSTDKVSQEYKELILKVEKLKTEIGEVREYQHLEECGLFSFRFNFEDIEKYADALHIIRQAQKKLIREEKAFICESLGLNGTPIVKNLSKLVILSFNSASELIIKNVKYNNYDSCELKLISLYNKINDMLAPFNSFLTEDYFKSKLKEMAISLEYQEEKQRIKQEQDELKAQIREEQRELEEAERARDQAIENEKEAMEALEKARKELEGKAEAEKEQFILKIKELESKLAEAHDKTVRAISNAQLTSVGHVYIISNIGSFGEGIFKIGMTRRDTPLDRVRELSDASVPFSFDVHALIYSENARKLESDLHHYFDTRRLNKINKRKEFFEVKLQEIENACREMNYSIKFTKLAEAIEFRKTKELTSNKEAS
ncbi:MAG: DUF4041 domain-containing protein [Bdellovibrionaceae bacterium]|nr:DUF4041 domain-containing protein [Pseudobdellovibrionaceae bacterium]